ncbi:phosphotransferase [Solwaraspora sp. WMMD1047]|uniref:phosphotransferase family protein n=1 Tax=Solwaraspora sp. WMMD1047 TaxID=3016102 RepID=UPI002415BADD|nr:phosphotransferase [Solwaraspora sp. WMMD1047]MDG4831763.1 phosphotransferase [Solwaraspora sp. WMMD1047]
MESLTRRRITEDELRALVRHGFGGTRISRWHELTGGTFNAAYWVRLIDGTELVLKVAPPPDLKLLTHEVDLMRTEVDFYRRAGRAGVPVPQVEHAGFDRSLVGSDFVFLSRVSGVGLDSVRDDLAPAGLAAVRAELAGHAARLHTITGPAYGYPLRDSRTWQPTWRAAFGAMVDDILADATRLGTVLPAGPDRIGELLRRHADLLDDVTRPALVHFDLWDGNVFVTPDGAGGARVTGLIDGERAFFGDPVAELVSLALLRDIADEPAILAGYAEVAGPERIELTGSVRRRLALYTSYLYLIMIVEGSPRGYVGPERAEFEDWLRDLLATQLSQL